MPISDEEVKAEEEFWCKRKGCNTDRHYCEKECEDQGLEDCTFDEED
jgi:hypothetical protein